MSRWTPEKMPDLTGKTALVTGANSGLGLETARLLAARGARVVITCRDRAKGEAAMAAIRASAPAAELRALTMDLASLASVRAAAEAFLAFDEPLDILCNNAGLMGVNLARTEDGFEMLFGVNHLGHFAFTGHLMPALEAASAARVVTVASLSAGRVESVAEDLNWERRAYVKSQAYGESKLANLCFMVELDRRLRAAGSSVISVASHPGYAATNVVFARDGQTGIKQTLWKLAAGLGNVTLAQPAARGAWPSLYGATMPAVRSGMYFGPGGIGQMRGAPVAIPVLEQASDLAHNEALWQQSVAMAGVDYL